jgi:hypothetical protein
VAGGPATTDSTPSRWSPTTAPSRRADLIGARRFIRNYKVILIGNATRDAELWYTGSGKAVPSICLATGRNVGEGEETQYYGGLGGAVAEVLADAGIGCRFKRHGVLDEYAPVGLPLALYAHYGLGGPGFAAVAKSFVG